MASCIWKKRLEAFEEFVSSNDLMKYPVDYCHGNDCSAIEQKMNECETCNVPFCEDCMDDHECRPLKQIKQ
jgi:hypothetical protein